MPYVPTDPLLSRLVFCSDTLRIENNHIFLVMQMVCMVFCVFCVCLSVCVCECK